MRDVGFVTEPPPIPDLFASCSWLEAKRHGRAEPVSLRPLSRVHKLVARSAGGLHRGYSYS